jgi:outer membrane protein TolC
MLRNKTSNSNRMPAPFRKPASYWFGFFLILSAISRADGQGLYSNLPSRDSILSIRGTFKNSDSVIQIKLVMLALQGPKYQVTGHLIKVSQYQLAKTKKSWLNLLALSGNFNDQTFAKTPVVATGTAEVVYPRYFFGVSVPLGVIFSLGSEVKGAKESVEVARSNQEQRAREIRTDVLSKYREFKNYGQLIGLQTTIVDDEQAAVKLAEKKFKDGTLSIEDYNTLNRAYNNDLAQKLNLQLAQDLVKLGIEEIIGIPLENVIN